MFGTNSKDGVEPRLQGDEDLRDDDGDGATRMMTMDDGNEATQVALNPLIREAMARKAVLAAAEVEPPAAEDEEKTRAGIPRVTTSSGNISRTAVPQQGTVGQETLVKLRRKDGTVIRESVLPPLIVPPQRLGAAPVSTTQQPNQGQSRKGTATGGLPPIAPPPSKLGKAKITGEPMSSEQAKATPGNLTNTGTHPIPLPQSKVIKRDEPAEARDISLAVPAQAIPAARGSSPTLLSATGLVSTETKPASVSVVTATTVQPEEGGFPSESDSIDIAETSEILPKVSLPSGRTGEPAMITPPQPQGIAAPSTTGDSHVGVVMNQRPSSIPGIRSRFSRMEKTDWVKVVGLGAIVVFIGYIASQRGTFESGRTHETLASTTTPYTPAPSTGATASTSTETNGTTSDIVITADAGAPVNVTPHRIHLPKAVATIQAIPAPTAIIQPAPTSQPDPTNDPDLVNPYTTASSIATTAPTTPSTTNPAQNE